MSWITGDDGTAMEAAATPGSLDPPAPEVRREMLRLQLEAEAAELAAEAATLAADAREAGDDEGEQVLEAAADEAAELRVVLAAEPTVPPIAGEDAAATDTPQAAIAEPAEGADEVRPTS